MPSYKTAFGSYLKTEDLQGKQTRVVIESVGLEEMKTEDGKETKLIARFHGKDKGLVLNRTNCEMLEEIIGTDDYESWAGQTVILYPTTTRFGNKTVPCLRIKQNIVAAAPVASRPAPRPPVPVMTTPPPTAEEVFDEAVGGEDDSDIPF